jgi:hypothetical protein
LFPVIKGRVTKEGSTRSRKLPMEVDHGTEATGAGAWEAGGEAGADAGGEAGAEVDATEVSTGFDALSAASAL